VKWERLCKDFRGRNSKGISKMKNLNDQFSDEEKQHLRYLGSMMGRRNTLEEQELEDILEAMEKRRKQNPEQDVQNQDQAFRDEGAEKHGG
jgi:hypothetical protein